MNTKYIIAVDAMGGEGSPKKVIDGISVFCETNSDIYATNALNEACENGHLEIIKWLLSNYAIPANCQCQKN